MNRHDISIITRDYHLLGIPIDQQPDILIDWTTAMLIFDLNTKLDIHLVQQKVTIEFLSFSNHLSLNSSDSIDDSSLLSYTCCYTH